ncbi:Mss4-like protein [Aspergillus pseudonomiae]|uniref:Mss4-like protein n=1 Tax=Aspergillus pseudonomiae TaxID=1506151 RepID=A0A5N6HLZ7_9EURO|nr:Mss4-like protein [Aspergillus pseudonomiae]KAB8255288.1 Mss4-like protein [Aspergillus pseudonomiae]KAE8404138.1 Mss4-like protein [Aspergillus pseudonomiae]
MHNDEVIHRISCLCGKAAQEVVLGADPSVLNLCHCTACRAITGQLYSSYHLLQTRPWNIDRFCEYRQSAGTSRYFCRTCGAHVFAHLEHTGQYFVAAGLIVEGPRRTKTIRHWRTRDTQDGGLASFLPGDSKETVSACWLELGSNNQPKHSAEIPPADDRSQSLRARCHCGGIVFYITRPDSTSVQPSSPWPDLLVPYYKSSSEKAQDVKWWLRDRSSRYLAGTCACRSCRLASGFPIQAWAFIPKSNLVNASGSPLVFTETTMQRYESSPDIYREFCNRCGATIFWHCKERPLVIDVSVGLLQSNHGTRAEELLEWYPGRVSFAEMAGDPPLMQRLESGLKGWSEKQGIGGK